MAKFDLKFIDALRDSDHIEVKVDGFDTSLIIIRSEEFSNSSFTEIVLDKSTAIKFAKTLRTEINKIED